LGRGGIPHLDYSGSYRPIYENEEGEIYAGSWISGSDLTHEGFAIISTMPIINEIVYLKQGESFGLSVTGTSSNFERIAGNFPYENDNYTISGMISRRSCIVTAKQDAHAGTQFAVKINQHSLDGARIGEQRSIQVVIIPRESEGIHTGKNGKVYVNYNGETYREISGGELGPLVTMN